MDGKNKFAKLQKIRNGGNVKRYHTIPIIREQSNAAHSWGVAVLFDQLWGKQATATGEQISEHKQLKEVEWTIEQLTKEAAKL